MKKTAESVLLSARANDEPVLVLRAKDKCVVKAIQAYIDECTRLECSAEHIDGINDILLEIALWRTNQPFAGGWDLCLHRPRAWPAP